MKIITILFCGINVRYVPRETLYLTFSLSYYILALDGRKIEIVNPQMNERDDLIALLASFSGKYYGRRSLERRKHKN